MSILDDAVITYSKQFEIPPKIVHAIIAVESSGNPYAMRFEPYWSYFVNCETKAPFRKLRPAEINSKRSPDYFPYFEEISSRDTEFVGQATSWGPMQVMGSVARELGHTGAFPELCGPLGVKYGCHLLHKLKLRFLEKHGWPGVISAYNQGSPKLIEGSNTYANQKYVDKVLKLVE